MELFKEGIETMDEALEIYHKNLDKVVPWSELEKTIEKLDEFRKDYSTEASKLIGEIKTKMMNGMDSYFGATQSVYEWCTYSIGVLGVYKKMYIGKMNQSKFNVQRELLLKVLQAGIDQMEEGKDSLMKCSGEFNNSAGDLTSLNHRLESDFQEKSEYFQRQLFRIRLTAYGSAAPFGLLGLAIAAGVTQGKIIPELKKKMESLQKFYKASTDLVTNAFKDIDETKKKLEDEIKVMGDLKSKTKETKTYVEMDNEEAMKEFIVEAVDELIKHCKEYRERHQ